MSIFDMQKMIDPETLSESIFDHEKARNVLIGMG